MKWLLILTLTTIITGEVISTPCCPHENAIVLHERRCTSHEEHFSFFNFSLNCTGDYFHILGNRDFTLRPDDGSLVLGTQVKYIIPTGKYCLARIVDDNDTFITEDEAALLCSPEEYSSLELSMEMKVYTGCILASAIMLLLTFIVYLLVPQLRDLQGKCLMSTVLSLCFAYTAIGLVLVQVFDVSPKYCAYQALFTYFWFLASFFWLNAVSFNIWRKAVFRRFPIADKPLLWIYYSYGWGLPLLFLTVATVMHHLPSEEEDLDSSCWFDGPVNMLIYFVLPVLALTFMNTLYFIWTGCRLWRGTDQSQSSHKVRSLRYKCLLYLKLFLIMGITWVFRVFAALLPGTKVTWIILNVITLLQGFFIFLILVLFRKRALRGLLELFQCKYCPQSWTAGEDHEDSEAILPEEVELSQTGT